MHPRLADRGWPAVARRRSAADKADTVPLGLPLPPRLGKLRLAVSVPLGVISAPIDPPSLADVADVAPSRWRPTVAALLAVGACFGLVPRPFGSLLWQALTGMPYVGPRSDIDLLWPLRVGTDVAGLVEALSGVAHASPVAIDGELLWAGEGAQWREYGEALRDGGEVLVKRLDGVSLRRVTAAASSGTARAPWEGLPSP